jgi:hypothetical protein
LRELHPSTAADEYASLQGGIKGNEVIELGLVDAEAAEGADLGAN